MTCTCQRCFIAIAQWHYWAGMCADCQRDDCPHGVDHERPCRGPRQPQIEDRRVTCRQCGGPSPVAHLAGMCGPCWERANEPVMIL